MELIEECPDYGWRAQDCDGSLRQRKNETWWWRHRPTDAQGDGNSRRGVVLPPASHMRPPKRPVPRRVCDSGQCEAGAEQKRNVAVPNADCCSWISHRKHGRWKAESGGASGAKLDEKMTYRETTRYHDAFPKDCEMSNEKWWQKISH